MLVTLSDLIIKQDRSGATIQVRALAGSSRTQMAGLHAGRLKIKVAAAPEKGKANKELTDFLAAAFGLAKSAVTVVSGQQNPQKRIHLAGITAAGIREQLESLLG